MGLKLVRVRSRDLDDEAEGEGGHHGGFHMIFQCGQYDDDHGTKRRVPFQIEVVELTAFSGPVGLPGCQALYRNGGYSEIRNFGLVGLCHFVY